MSVALKGGVWRSKVSDDFSVSKGLAILLVIIGHNKFFQEELTEVVKIIYNFHVFFFLAHFCLSDSIDYTKLRQRLIRYMYPLIWSAGASMALFFVFFGVSFNFEYILGKLLQGGGGIRDVFGFGFFWFCFSLPILCLYLVFKKVFAVKVLVVVFSLVAFYCYYVVDILSITFLCLAIGFSFIWLSELFGLFRYVVNVLSPLFQAVFVLVGYFFSLSFVLSEGMYVNIGEVYLSKAGWGLFANMIFGALFIELLANMLSKCVLVNRFLSWLGDKSYSVYIVHSFFSYFYYFVISSYFDSGLVVGFFVLIFTIFSVYIFLKALEVFSLSPYFFPRGV